MKVDFIDFVPEMYDRGGLLRPPSMEDMVKVVARLNKWLARNEVKVLNVETVVLPNIHLPNEEGSQDTNVTIKDGFPASWHQFARVWYEIPRSGEKHDTPPPST